MGGAQNGRGKSEVEPSADELAAMAYADGELAPDERAAFERRLAGSASLAREVARHQALAVLARRLAPLEPADHEWRRLAADPVQRGAVGLGWVTLGVGALGLAGLALWRYETDPSVDPLERGLVLSLVVGATLLLAAAIRARLKTLPLDPYRNVER